MTSSKNKKLKYFFFKSTQFRKQKDDVSRQLFDIRHKYETERKTREDLEKNQGRNNDELQKLKDTITDYERQVFTWKIKKRQSYNLGHPAASS